MSGPGRRGWYNDSLYPNGVEIMPRDGDRAALEAFAERIRHAHGEIIVAAGLLATALRPAAEAIAEISRALYPLEELELRRPRGPRRLLGEREIRAALARHRRRP